MNGGELVLDGEAPTGDEPPQPAELTRKQKKKKEKVMRVLQRDAGAVLHTLEVKEILPVSGTVNWTEDPEIVCCYNWSEDARSNTIFVPGQPPKWTPPDLPHTLKLDGGLKYSDYNYVRNNRNPYEPMFHALNIMNPNFQFHNVDVIADRNNLRKLLEFVAGKSNGPWRLDLYVVQNTLIIVKKDSSFWKKANDQGYGDNFEQAFTIPGEGMEDATSHYRAIRYEMGPLNVVVRFEADAHYDGSDELNPSEAQHVKGDLLQRPFFDFRAPIQVVQKGHIVPMSQMAELKSTVYKPDNCKRVACMDQLWFGRTKHLFTGYYSIKDEGGVIRSIKQEDATERIKKWETTQQENLRKLANLLSLLKKMVKNEPPPIRSLMLVRETSNGPLIIRKLGFKQHIVSRDFFQKHWARRDTYSQQGGSRGSYNPGYGRARGDSYAGRSYSNPDLNSTDLRRNNLGSSRGNHNVYHGTGGYQGGELNRGRGYGGGYNGGSSGQGNVGRGRGRGRGYSAYGGGGREEGLSRQH
ncbi:hypothetical protein CC80DRAFT_149001 [Byssothecium circinans]|uniref:Geranylgeranyl pyrophosphate synthetase n=1 Tax=Byssothecium circinans TaxID=147558 RepID=A0A6A5TNA3_9PLEO|nr:hypothetical protein CC80DRAFT_149001 [Byssothecium circinans]